MQEAFLELTQKQTGQKLTVVNCDDPKSRCLLTGSNVVTYGFSPRADVHIDHVSTGEERMFFRLSRKSMAMGEFTLKVAGRHNVANATAALVACQAAGLAVDVLREGLLTFTGTKRRFEKIGEKEGVLYFDDYAHHPAEIRATLAAARLWYPKRKIIAVFQPHTYSRTKALMGEFAGSFSDANVVLLTDIYASAREHDTLGLDGKSLVAHTLRQKRDVYYAPTREAVTTALRTHATAGDVVIFMGAGDIYTWEGTIVQGEGRGSV